MWLYTRYGFFSVVCARKVVGGQVSGEIDPSRVMIRARNREHLDKLKEKFADVVGDPEIHVGSGTDYRQRIFIDHSQWGELAGRLASDIDYDNFKDAAYDKGMDSGYVDLLGDVWSKSYSYQSDCHESDDQ